MTIVAIDTGGTFTDLAAYDRDSGAIVCVKSLTTYDDLVAGVMTCAGRAKIALAEEQLFKHGTTLVINALLQRQGARTALVTTSGFRDVLEIGRGNRPIPYDLYYRRQPPLIPREWRFEIAERTSATGETLIVPAHDEVAALAERLRALGAEAVAVCFLHGFRWPAHEELVANWLRELLPGVFVSASSELSREWYEFERTATVAANAFVGPQVAGYVDRLGGALGEGGFDGRFLMMGSNGGVLALDRAVREPINLVESGPVGGCIGAAVYAEALGIENIIAFDMGGTTAKCALVQGGRFDVKPVYHVGGYDTGFPVRSAVIDIVEVGAGGGSIAWLDDQARLHVGPRSAGSAPGPVCYGRGGEEPTVTDANIVLGRIDPKGLLGGEMALDGDAAARVFAARVAEPLGYEGADALARVADGVLAIASVTMAGAIKRITVERGRDPRDFALCAYGGGGPLHAVQLARELHIPIVVIPPEPGNFSAIGMLLADVRRDEARTFLAPLEEAAIAEMTTLFAEMEDELARGLHAEMPSARVTMEREAEIRYRGQVHTVRVPLESALAADDIRARFDRNYAARYGHADPDNPAELVSLHVAAFALMERPDLRSLAPRRAAASAVPSRREVHFGPHHGAHMAAVLARADLPAGFTGEGPAVIEEYGSTTLVWPGDRFAVGELGEIRIEVASATGGRS